MRYYWCMVRDAAGAGTWRMMRAPQAGWLRDLTCKVDLPRGYAFCFFIHSSFLWRYNFSNTVFLMVKKIHGFPL